MIKVVMFDLGQTLIDEANQLRPFPHAVENADHHRQEEFHGRAADVAVRWKTGFGSGSARRDDTPFKNDMSIEALKSKYEQLMQLPKINAFALGVRALEYAGFASGAAAARREFLS